MNLDYSPKHIVIENDGVMDLNAIRLIGASSKRGDSSKIGHFGSGGCYALAYLLRNNINFSLYIGMHKVAIEKHTTDFRGKPVDVIHVDGVPTSMTTDMGPKWTTYQAFRELYCNSLDEGSEDPVRLVSEYQPEENKTAFVIENVGEMSDVITNFNQYFSRNTKVVYSGAIGNIIEKASPDCLRIYRKGILVHTEKTDGYAYDYDLTNLELTEDRTALYPWSWKQGVLELLYSCADKGVVRKVVDTNAKELSLTNDSYVSTYSSELTPVWEEVIGNRTIATATQVAFASDLKQPLSGELLTLPEKVFEDVKTVFPNVKTLFSGKGGSDYVIEPTTASQKQLIDRVMEKLQASNINITYPINVVKFSKDELMGMADRESMTILISSKVFYQGDQVVMETLLEEWVHLEFNVNDNTRDMQDVLLRLVSQKVMEG